MSNEIDEGARINMVRNYIFKIHDVLFPDLEVRKRLRVDKIGNIF